MNEVKKPHIVLVVARGEAVRNFLYSDTLRQLCDHARVTLLSTITDPDTLKHFTGAPDRVVELKEYPEKYLVSLFRYFLHMAHLRWLWSEASKFSWEAHYAYATTYKARVRVRLARGIGRILAHQSLLEKMTSVDRFLSWRFRPANDFEQLFNELRPDLVFNCSHIHGPMADLPMRVAEGMGFKTAAFIFSWDNLTSRSRIFVPYDYYLVWTDNIREDFLRLYPFVDKDRVIVTGTPQFDYHFNPEFTMQREEFCRRIGLDPSRPYILYTTGRSQDFPDEHIIVKEVIRYIQETTISPKPQLVVRTYLKGNSSEMEDLSKGSFPDVVFPTVLWEKKWLLPLYNDLIFYTSLLRHCSLGINAASTVTLELMMLGKPVINLGFDPPGSNVPYFNRFSRHVDYEHYKPVAYSGGVLLAKSLEDVPLMIHKGLSEPDSYHKEQAKFIDNFFGGTLDGKSSQRVAETLLALAKQ